MSTTYGQYCPLARAMELLGERWTLLVVRDLLIGTRRFNDLARGLPRMSRSLLSTRLSTLCDAGIVQRVRRADGRAAEYRPTEAGRALWPVVEGLLGWGARWAFDQPRGDELDPVLLMWWIRRGTVPERCPEGGVTIEFEFVDDEKGRYWIVVEPSDVSVCLDPPPFDVDLWVRTDLASMYRVWLGRVDILRALEDGRLRLHGPPSLERAFPRWFDLSAAAPAVEAAFDGRR